MNYWSLSSGLTFFRLLIFTTLIGVGYTSLLGQIYPVTGNIRWIPPYTPVLSEISLPSASDNFGLILLLNDQQNLSATVKLKFKIEGSGVRIQTDPNYQGLPITLTHGVPENFNGVDLSDYLRATSLQFAGMTREQYIRNASIPDGFYKVSFQVFDFQTNEALSDEIFLQTFIATNEPPLLIAPTCQEKLRITDPQYLMFSWLGRQVNSGVTDYEFSLYWVQPKGRPAGDVVLTSVPIYQETTQGNSLIYSSSEPALIPGEEYVWRVQAKDRSEISNYHQYGFSMPCKFTYGDACFPPENVQSTVEGAQRVKISWDESPAVVRYQVEYRLKNSSIGQWYPLQTTNTNYTLSSQLRASTSYEFRVQSVCGIISSDYSPIDTFRTGELFQNRTLTCGPRSSIPLPDSSTKLATLAAGDIIEMGGFTMTVLSASGANGKFSGKVQIPVNLLNATLEGDFIDLRINANRQVFAGIVQVRSGSVPLIPPAVQAKVKSYLDAINVTLNTVDGGLANASTILNNSSSVLENIEKIATEVGKYDSIYGPKLEDIKNQIQNAVSQISGGDSTAGKINFQNAINQLMDLLEGGASGTYAKLKELLKTKLAFHKSEDSARASRFRIQFDSLRIIHLRSIREIKTRNESYSMGTGENTFYDPESVAEEEDKEVMSESDLTGLKENPKLKLFIETTELVAEKSKKLNEALNKLAILKKYLDNPPDFEDLFGALKGSLQDLGTDVAKDILAGKNLQSAEAYVDQYVIEVVEDQLAQQYR